MYTLEQLEKIWGIQQPLYFKVVEGKKPNGIGRGTYAYKQQKGEGKTAEDVPPDVRAKESKELWNTLLQVLELQPDGYYTIVMQTSQSASSTSSPYTIAKGDVSNIAGMGLTEWQSGSNQNNNNNAFNSTNVMVMMMQMMQQQNNQMMQMQQQNFATMMQMVGQSNAKDLELFKARQRKGFDDKIFGLLEKPHVMGAAVKIMEKLEQKPFAVGRAEATEGATVPPAEPPPPPPTEGGKPNTINREDAIKLGQLMEKVKADYPGQNPVDVLDNGYMMAREYINAKKQVAEANE